MAVFGCKHVLIEIQMRLQAFAKSSFHFLKRHHRERDQSRSSQGKLRRVAGLHKCRQWHHTAFRARFLHDPAQTSSDAGRNKCVAVTPEIDP